eukprot:CAMPEP_0184303442 /NCGR_PEP_ID=MMETSP1049-20130417/13188_1 /TAXON_ID=77928 /ORGANISM="Proteomonas sulcata, Strain CCMP704" /LENGTH=504 /DNA_ID=CAMNT_0026614997 /DNA_START=133 /DNA_END=1647 /DNA_ORIENTATION=+
MGGGASRPTPDSQAETKLLPATVVGTEELKAPLQITIGQYEHQDEGGCSAAQQRSPSPNIQALNPHMVPSELTEGSSPNENPSEAPNPRPLPPNVAQLKAMHTPSMRASFKEGIGRSASTMKQGFERTTSTVKETFRSTFRLNYRFQPTSRGIPCTIEQAEKTVGLVQFDTGKGYWHTGVSLGNGQIAHFAANATGEVAKEGPGTVILHRLKLVLNGATCIEMLQRDVVEWNPIKSDEAVFDRVIDIFLRGFGRYHHIYNNCEDFALNAMYLNPPRKQPESPKEEPKSLAEQGAAYLRRTMKGESDELPREIHTPDLLDTLKLTDVFTKGGPRKPRFQQKGSNSRRSASPPSRKGLVKSKSMEFFFGPSDPVLTRESPVLPRIPSQPLSIEELSERGLKTSVSEDNLNVPLDRESTIQVIDLSGRSEPMALSELSRSETEQAEDASRRSEWLVHERKQIVVGNHRGNGWNEESTIAGLPGDIKVAKDALRQSNSFGGHGRSVWN